MRRYVSGSSRAKSSPPQKGSQPVDDHLLLLHQQDARPVHLRVSSRRSLLEVSGGVDGHPT